MKPRKQDEKILSDQYSYFEPIISDSCDIKFDETRGEWVLYSFHMKRFVL
ncbi:hypothetical protein StPhP954_gp05 [Staphylococcus phage P954]|uniref:Uncharacterized protein n=1 Tax=Staphylococcus phage P954 TaxID=668618 RepID=C8CGX6_9CAUD|nr:hypothetical protein StPhP954_gp05 [Staphylococcus phage P954]ACV04946.1 hypothetical protein [Staphylococcus phage P954]